MSLLSFFRRPAPLRGLASLADFIDENSAFLVQKGIYEYSRARSGPFSKSLLVEPGFIASVNVSRWKAYPFGLAMIGEMVEATLQPFNEGERRAILDPLAALVLSVFDRYPVPEALDKNTWAAAREDLALKLNQIGTHPPKRIIDIPVPYAESYFAMMPIHEKMRSHDVPTTRSYLQLSLVNIHNEFLKRGDIKTLIEELRAKQN